MLTTQFLGAGAFQTGFGAVASTPATADLQRYLAQLGKLPQSQVTGVMNDATMAVIFNLLIDTAAVISKILPTDVRDGINRVVTDLKDADNKLKSVTFGQVGLSFVLQHFTDATAAARMISSSAADEMLSIRDTVYNAVAGQAATIQKAFQIFFPAPGGTFTVIRGVFRPGTSTGTVVPGTIYVFSPKLGKYRVAVPKTPAVKAAGFGNVGIMSDGMFGGECIFGDCGLGAAATFTEVAPSTTPPAAPATQTTESDFEKKTGTQPFYKKPLFWIATAGGVAAVGGGYWYVKHRRKIAMPAKAAYY